MQPTGSGGCPSHRPISTQHAARCLKRGTMYGHAGRWPYRHLRKSNVRSYLDICFCGPLSKGMHKVRARGCHVLQCEWIRGVIGLFWGFSWAGGKQMEAGSQVEGRGDVWVSVWVSVWGRVFAQLADPAGRMTQLWAVQAARCKIRNQVNNEL